MRDQGVRDVAREIVPGWREARDEDLAVTVISECPPSGAVVGMEPQSMTALPVMIIRRRWHHEPSLQAVPQDGGRPSRVAGRPGAHLRPEHRGPCEPSRLPFPTSTPPLSFGHR
jgi:hypothetical protein